MGSSVTVCALEGCPDIGEAAPVRGRLGEMGLDLCGAYLWRQVRGDWVDVTPEFPGWNEGEARWDREQARWVLREVSDAP